MVELRVERLRVAVLSPLNEHGHHPGRERGNRMPIECLAGKNEPKGTVSQHYEECCRARRLNAEASKTVSDIRNHWGNQVGLSGRRLRELTPRPRQRCARLWLRP